MSVYGIKYYRTNGVLPGASRAPYGSSKIDPDKDAFSTAPHEYAEMHNNDNDLESDMHEHETVVGDQFDTSYNGGYVSSHHGGSVSSHGSHDNVHDNVSFSGGSENRVHFPPANYAEGRTPLHI